MVARPHVYVPRPPVGQPGDPQAELNGGGAMAAGDSPAEFLEQAQVAFKGLVAEGKTLIELQRSKLVLAGKEGAHRLLFLAWAWIAFSVATAVASVLFLLGLGGGLASLAGDRPWVGSLLAGALGLSAGLVGLRALRSRMRRSFASSLEARHLGAN